METFPITSDQIESSCNRIVESRGLSSSFNQRCGEPKEFAENLTYEHRNRKGALQTLHSKLSI